MKGKRENSGDPLQRACRSAGLLAAGALAALCLCGCFMTRELHVADEPLPRDRIREIRRGVTTRQEILERFGPPVAVARHGSTMVYPPPGRTKQGRVEVPSDAFFELFSTGHAPMDSEIVYFYDASRFEATGILVIPIGSYSTRVAVERLWLFIDERKGIVQEYVLRGAD
ncbi:MAG: hypothetical protein ACM3OG_08335 [Actinomycetota bacterium]